MNTHTGQRDNRRLRAPCEDGAALIEPPLSELAALVEENVRLSVNRSYDFQGRSLVELSAQARAELVGQARRFSAAYRDVDSAATDDAGLIFLAGHQPQLCHPGVWWKNFALDDLARRHGAVAVNLRIDCDTVKDTVIAVPGGSVGKPHVEPVAFDRAESKIPYEERPIVDRALFAGFGGRVAERIAPLVADPLVRQYWPMVLGHAERTGNLGASMADARHELEGCWGLQTLEIPQSWVCESEPFRWFAVHLLAQAERFSRVYNEVVGEYRRAHRIRSVAHPVPDLAVAPPWFEAPLWMWTTDDPRRRRVFVCRHRDRIELADRGALRFELPLAADGDARRAVQRLADLRRDGVKIRSRALITTLWARLALSDLFLHGIGGAKYDQVTDVLIERFFRLQPPGLMVLSATLLLPIPRQPVSEDDARAIQQQLRDLVYHPERYIDGQDVAPTRGLTNPGGLIAEKRRWVDTPPTPQNARRRCRAIRRINEQLQRYVKPQRRRLLALQAETAHALHAASALSRREYAFCLHPEKNFRQFAFHLLHKNA